jgi:hypothetical protein
VSRPVDFMACFLLRHLWELYRFLGIPSHTYTHLMSYHLYLYLTYICTHVATMRLIQLPLLLHLPRKIHPMNRSDIRFIYSLLVSILQLTTSIKTRSLPTENIPTLTGRRPCAQCTLNDASVRLLQSLSKIVKPSMHVHPVSNKAHRTDCCLERARLRSSSSTPCICQLIGP